MWRVAVWTRLWSEDLKGILQQNPAQVGRCGARRNSQTQTLDYNHPPSDWDSVTNTWNLVEDQEAGFANVQISMSHKCLTRFIICIFYISRANTPPWGSCGSSHSCQSVFEQDVNSSYQRSNLKPITGCDQFRADYVISHIGRLFLCLHILKRITGF